MLWLGVLAVDILAAYRSGKVCRHHDAKAVSTSDLDLDRDVDTGVKAVPETTCTENPNYSGVVV